LAGIRLQLTGITKLSWQAGLCACKTIKVILSMVRADHCKFSSS